MSLLGDELPAVRVQLSHSKKSIEARGRISWTSGLRKTAGLEFVGLSPEARSLLREWVAMETPAGELIEEMTSPIEKSSLEAAAPPPPTEAAKLDLKRGFALSPAEKPSKLTESLSAAKEEVAERFPLRRMYRTLTDIDAIPAPPVLSVPATPAEPAVNVPVAATAPSAPQAAEDDSPGLLHPSASLPDDRFGFKQLSALSGSPAATPSETAGKWRSWWPFLRECLWPRAGLPDTAPCMGSSVRPRRKPPMTLLRPKIPKWRLRQTKHFQHRSGRFE